MILDIPAPPTVDAIILKRAGDHSFVKSVHDPQQFSGLLYLYFLGEFAAERIARFLRRMTVLFATPWGKALRSGAQRAPGKGDRAAQEIDCIILWRPHPAAGSHLLAEGTAPPLYDRTIPRRRALPCTKKTAHSTPFNCRVQDKECSSLVFLNFHHVPFRTEYSKVIGSSGARSHSSRISAAVSPKAISCRRQRIFNTPSLDSKTPQVCKVSPPAP